MLIVLGLCVAWWGLGERDALVWMLPTVSGTGMVVTAVLARSAAGCGCLRTMGLGWKTSGATTQRWEPATQLRVWGALLVITLALAIASVAR
jgi:hypothetical protein